jgi:integrase
MKLTEKIIAGLDLPADVDERLFSDDDLTGLNLRLRRGANGKIARSWVYRYQIAKVPKKLTFDFAGHNLAGIRKLAGDLQARIRLGHDPASDRAQAEADIRQTVAATVEAFLPQKALSLRPGSLRLVTRCLRVLLEPLHSKPLRLVSRNDVADLYLKIATEIGHATANNGWKAWSAFFSWCLRRGLLDQSPCAAGIERFPYRERDRVLAAFEIKAVWHATAGDADYDRIVRLLMLTGCRAAEIGGLQWSEIYSDRIVLPPERVKNAHQHTLPLTGTMKAILSRCSPRPSNPYVFGRDDGRPFTGWDRSKKDLDARIKAAGIAVEHWVVHDLRRTCATGLQRLGVRLEVTEAILNHVSGSRGGIVAVYQRHEYDGEKRAALEAWDTHVKEIVEGRTIGDRVVPLVQRA